MIFLKLACKPPTGKSNRKRRGMRGKSTQTVTGIKKKKRTKGKDGLLRTRALEDSMEEGGTVPNTTV